MAKEMTSIRMKENYKPKPIIDMTGKRYGLLTVLEMCEHKIGEDVEHGWKWRKRTLADRI